MPKKEFIPKIAMSIHAHPDDHEFIVAVTLAKWAAKPFGIVKRIRKSVHPSPLELIPILIDAELP
jgi:hypothetical protein